jgi:choline dehydrogenase
MEYDYIVVGAGSAGSVVAGRLAEDPSVNVLLIEAGPSDKSPLIRLPKGTVKLMADRRHAYFYSTEWREAGGEPEVVLRGRGLGGSGSINGMVYHRSQPQDHDELTALGLGGWGWEEMLECYRGLEDSPLPETEWRGRGGAIPLRIARSTSPLSGAITEAANELGLPTLEEPSVPHQLGVAPIVENIDERAERFSSARAFLRGRRRPNLRILVNTRADRIVFEGRRAVGVTTTRGAVREEHRARREIVLCAGALESPRLLQISGVGPADHLRDIGVGVVVDLPGVGANSRDHFAHVSQWRVRDHALSENREYVGWRLARNVLRYYARRTGPLAGGPMKLVVFAQVLDDASGRADAELLHAPFSFSALPGKDDDIVLDPDPGCTFISFPLRPTSRGTVMARSADPADPPVIDPRYLDTDYDRAVTIELVRFLKRLMTQPALAPYVVAELGEAANVDTDDEIIDLVRRTGKSCFHNVGTCKMGGDADPTAVLDARLHVRGIAGLRVADCSVLPVQISAEPNGPAMAIGWRAAELLRADHL